MCIYIGPGVLGLPLLQKHVGYDLVELSYHLEHGVIGKVLEGKLTLTGIARISLPENSVAISWDHLNNYTRENEHNHPSYCDQSALRLS